MTDGTTSSESVYMRLGELSGKLDAVLQQTTIATTDAAVGRALALNIESRLKENRTIEKANAASAELSNRRFLLKVGAGVLTTIGLLLGILYYLHSIYHWPT